MEGKVVATSVRFHLAVFLWFVGMDNIQGIEFWIGIDMVWWEGAEVPLPMESFLIKEEMKSTCRIN